MTLDALRSLQEEVDRPNDFSAKHIAATDLLYYTLSAHLLPLAEALKAVLEEARGMSFQIHGDRCVSPHDESECEPPALRPADKALRNLQDALE